MTTPAHAERESPPTVILLGSGPDGLAGRGTADPADGNAADLLATADAVFAGPPRPDVDPEAVALFYVEAWRVERLDAPVAAARLDDWFGARRTGTAVIVVAGPVESDVAFGAALDGLVLLRPGLRVDRRSGVGVAPPRRSPLIR